MHKHAAKRGQSGCNVYPYLSTPTLRRRHVLAASFLDKWGVQSILDIGAYTNPIHSFMSSCPNEIFIVEPCGELVDVAGQEGLAYFSGPIACGSQSTTVHVMPTTIAEFYQSPEMMNPFDAVVCIGCDPAYGPTWNMLASLQRPFRLLLEYSLTYAPAVNEYASSKLYADNCTVRSQKVFDFSSCADCGDTKHANRRVLLVIFCGARPMRKERETERRNALTLAWHKRIFSRRPGRYQIEARKAELNIKDPALMAQRVHKDDRLTSLARKQRVLTSRWRRNNRLCRVWHNEAPVFFEEAARALDADANRSFDWPLMQRVDSVRCNLNAAKPTATAFPLLLRAIRILDHGLKNLLQIAPESAPISQNNMLRQCPRVKRRWINLTDYIEPILPTGRNLAYREFGHLTNFAPYVRLVTFPSVRQAIEASRRVLIDVGSNGFAASTKQLLDGYAAYLPFTHSYSFDDHDDTSQIPAEYNQTRVIFEQRFVTNLLSWVTSNVLPSDFVVLKYDVDDGTHGLTMEWGFLDGLLRSPTIGYIDEIYIEMHYQDKSIGWHHYAHGGQQRYDLMHQLRACGLVIHEWP